MLLEAANFEPSAIFRTSERLRLRTEGSNRWEKGVDPYLAEQAASSRRADRRRRAPSWIGDVDVQGELPERPVIRFRPERADELIGLETPAEEQTRWLERLGFEAARRRSSSPTWRARDVTREVDVVEEVARFRLEDVPFTLPERRAMFGALTRCSSCAGGSRTCSRGSGSPRRTRRRCAPRIRPDALKLRSRSRSSSRCSGRACSRASSRRPAATSSSEPRASRSSRSRASTCPRELPDERMRVAGIAEGGFARVKGVVETLYAALKAEPGFERRPTTLLHPARRPTAPGIVGELHPGVLEGTWGGFELELEGCSQASREPQLQGRDHVPGGPPGPRVRGPRRGRRRRSRRRRAGGRRPRAARDARLRRLPGRPGRRGAEVDRVRGRFQSSERTLSDEDAAALRERIVAGARAALRRRAQGVAVARRSAIARRILRWISGELVSSLPKFRS